VYRQKIDDHILPPNANTAMQPICTGLAESSDFCSIADRLLIMWFETKLLVCDPSPDGDGPNLTGPCIPTSANIVQIS